VTFDYSETVFTDPFDAVWLNRSQSRRPRSALHASRSLLGGAAPPGGRKRVPSGTGRRAEAFDLVKAPPAGKKLARVLILAGVQLVVALVDDSVACDAYDGPLGLRPTANGTPP